MSGRRPAARALLAVPASLAMVMTLAMPLPSAGSPAGGNYATEARIAFAWADSGEAVRTFEYAVILRAARPLACDSPSVAFTVPDGATVSSARALTPEGSLPLCAGGALPVVATTGTFPAGTNDIAAMASLGASPARDGKGRKGRLPLALLSLTGGDGDAVADDRCLDAGYPSAPIGCQLAVQEQR